ncbi:hypothetical protein [Spirosoma agri]|uniref:Secretion system C-terminal sorting domain-containing protein n=1 Tax=Spirosoma agri TaxID=1987381 RepID=A0A6M0INR1_9BACT|nr:hypothetical protein [Spirosoma agri]NEU69195.1 hypothetical protein [Spirosoma agri]
MKTLIQSLALALTLGFVSTAASFAETNPGGRQAAVATYKTGIYTSIDGKLNIALDKATGGAVDICLKNPDGSIAFNKHLGKGESKSRIRLNLSDLPDGVYKVEITNGVDVTSQSVTLSTQKPTTPSRLVAIN